MTNAFTIARISAALAIAGTVWLAAGCGDEEGPRTTGAIDYSIDAGDADLTALSRPPKPCKDGTIATCKVNLPTHNNVTSCFNGVKVCADGKWGPCVGRETVEGGTALYGEGGPPEFTEAGADSGVVK